MKVRVLMAAELDVDVLPPGGDADAAAQVRLDAFREAVLPADNYGITLYRVNRADVEVMARDGLTPGGLYVVPDQGG